VHKRRCPNLCVAKRAVAVSSQRVDERGPDERRVRFSEPRVRHERGERGERPAPQPVVRGAPHAVEQAGHHGRHRVRRFCVRQLLAGAAGLLRRRGGSFLGRLVACCVARPRPCRTRFEEQRGQAFAGLLVAAAASGGDAVATRQA
jgi:hypothetical protein